MDFKREVGLFEKVYKEAEYSPYVRWNPKYKTEKFRGMTPYICLHDICYYKYVVCAIPIEECTTPLYVFKRRNMIAEYNSIEEMVEDGWLLDT